MNVKLFFFLLIPSLGFSQVQIGQDIDGESLGDGFGSNVAISGNGNIFAAGAPHNDGNGTSSGHVRVYENMSNVWTQIGQDIDGAVIGDAFGSSISLSKDGLVLAISSQNSNTNGMSSGHVRVYNYISGNWKQIGNDINGESAYNYSGGSISLSSNGKIIAIGAVGNNDNGISSGHVRVYENILGVWQQLGIDIDGEAAGDMSGSSVSLSSDGSTVAIGAYHNSGNAKYSGHVRVYKYILGVWTQIGNDIDGDSANDFSGHSVSLSSDGSIVAIGATTVDKAGYVSVYKNNNGVWTKLGTNIEGEQLTDRSGYDVSLSEHGNILAISAIDNNGNGISSGHVRIYQNISNVWTKMGIDIDGEAAGDTSGESVCLSSDGTIISIGASNNDGNGLNSGHVRVYDLSGVLSNNDFVSQNFNIYPNPTSDIININLENDLILKQVTIYNNLGQIVKTATENVIDVSHLAKGLYFLEVNTDKGKATKKVVIK